MFRYYSQTVSASLLWCAGPSMTSVNMIAFIVTLFSSLSGPLQQSFVSHVDDMSYVSEKQRNTVVNVKDEWLKPAHLQAFITVLQPSSLGSSSRGLATARCSSTAECLTAFFSPQEVKQQLVVFLRDVKSGSWCFPLVLCSCADMTLMRLPCQRLS